MTALEVAREPPAKAWVEVAWREGARGYMCSRFKTLRIRTSHRDFQRQKPRPVEWLKIE